MNILYIPDEYSQQRQRDKKVYIYPVLMAMEAQWYINNGHDVTWITNPDALKSVNNGFWRQQYDKILSSAEGLPFSSLPAPDRVFTNAFDRRYQVYGNYKYHPASHIQVADGCWWGKCEFCVENGKKYVVRKMDDVMNEIDECHRLGFRELFDDSGSFPDGEWLNEFCRLMKKKPYNMVLGCNMRIDGRCDYKLMKEAGFRMVLFGVESINQGTLDRIRKGIKVNEITNTLRKATRSGIECHTTFMSGFRWETGQEERRTLDYAHYLLRKGISRTAQMSLYDTPRERGIDRGTKRKIYEVAWSPEFWFNQVKNIRKWEDVKYLCKGIKKGITNA